MVFLSRLAGFPWGFLLIFLTISLIHLGRILVSVLSLQYLTFGYTGVLYDSLTIALPPFGVGCCSIGHSPMPSSSSNNNSLRRVTTRSSSSASASASVSARFCRSFGKGFWMKFWGFFFENFEFSLRQHEVLDPKSSLNC